MTNPFNPNVPGNNYTPPAAIIERLESGLADGTSFAVSGAPKYGKTSLLRALDERLGNGIYISPEAYEIPTSERFFRDVLHAVRPEQDYPRKDFAREPYRVFTETLLPHAATNGRWTLLVDDALELFTHPGTRRLPNHLLHLATLSPLQDNFRCVFTHEIVTDLPAPCLEFTASLYLPQLDVHEIEAIARRHLAADVLPDASILYLAKLTHGRPQSVLGGLRNAWKIVGPDFRRVLTPQDLHDAVASYHNSHRLSRLADYVPPPAQNC